MKHIYRFLTGLATLLIIAVLFVYLPYKIGIDPVMLFGAVVISIGSSILIYGIGVLVRMSIFKNDDHESK